MLAYKVSSCELSYKSEGGRTYIPTKVILHTYIPTQHTCLIYFNCGNDLWIAAAKHYRKKTSPSPSSMGSRERDHRERERE